MGVINCIENNLNIVLKEILTNSLKYRSNKEAVNIQITYSIIDKMHKISIKDDGIGITPKYSKKVFIMFQKLNDHHKFHGIGAGLVFCKKIINFWSGDIWVNPYVKNGTEITFTIPLLQNNR
ncbi:MAG: light-regulated signal transduction histidine kinase (bacteriophytochrome) [Sphingobacteriales bacterium]|jgi:light-regulated signal transduction histidine kinase (bacteriophytochrome)